jgi:hypothetical protein
MNPKNKIRHMSVSSAFGARWWRGRRLRNSPEIGHALDSRTLGQWRVLTLPIEMSFYSVVFLLLAIDRFRYIGALACALTTVCAPYLLCIYAHALGLLTLPDLDLDYGMVKLSLLRHGQYFALGIFIYLMRESPATALVCVCFVLGLLDGTVEIIIESMHVSPIYGVPMPASTFYISVLTIWLVSVGLLVLLTFFSTAFPRICACARWSGSSAS